MSALAILLPSTTALALTMLVLALINAALMAWLWRFPMRADPSSPNPHGRSTAPPAGLWLHRLIGYAFVLCLLALLIKMLPRLWTYSEWSALSLLHALGGLALIAVLTIKLWVIRRRPQASAWLPWLGGSLATLTVIVALSGALPSLWLQRTLPQLSAEAAMGQRLLAQRCLQCHGASVIAAERRRPERWHRELREMQRRASVRADAIPISDHERALIAAFLDETQGKKPRGRERDY